MLEFICPVLKIDQEIKFIQAKQLTSIKKLCCLFSVCFSWVQQHMKWKQHQMGPVYTVVCLMKMTQSLCLMRLKTPWLTPPHCNLISIEFLIISLLFYPFQSPTQYFSGGQLASYRFQLFTQQRHEEVGSCAATGQSRCPICAMVDQRLHSHQWMFPKVLSKLWSNTALPESQF